MDVLKIKSAFTKMIITKVLTKAIRKKLGDYVTDISINDIEILVDDMEVKLHLDVNAKAKKEVMSELIKYI